MKNNVLKRKSTPIGRPSSFPLGVERLSAIAFVLVSRFSSFPLGVQRLSAIAFLTVSRFFSFPFIFLATFS